MGLPRRKGRLRPGRAAAPLRTGALRSSGQGRRPPTCQADAIPKPFGVVVRQSERQCDQTFLEIANNSPYPIRLAGKLDLPPGAPIEDLGRGLRLGPACPGRRQQPGARPAALWCRRDQDRGAAGEAFVGEYLSFGRRDDFACGPASTSCRRSSRGSITGSRPAPAEPANPGFEPTRQRGRRRSQAGRWSRSPRPRAGARSDLAGWLVEGPTPGEATIKVDRENPHSGQGSLKLSAPAAPSSVVSESFVPNNHSSLTIEAFFRASEPETKVRVWIEGASGGKPYVRRTEMTVSTAWEGRAVRASDVPAGGLDSARLRFELLAPGNLWIDDLHVPSETTSRSGLLNARRTLLEAIQAYREERYAEFARLAGSHWIQGVECRRDHAAGTGTRPDVAAGGGPARPGGTEPSALSPDRKRR